MIGREEKKKNDLFYTCSLIEYIARKTKNHSTAVVDALGKERIKKIYELADIYHSDSIERVSDDFIAESGLRSGDFDNIALARYSIPSYWDIGKIYKRLILGIAKEEEKEIIDALHSAYHSFVVEKIEDYNSSFYYENPQYILDSYLSGVVE